MAAPEELDSRSEALQALVADCLERMERDGSAALDAFCAEHAGQAGAIRQRVEMLQAMGLVGSGTERPDDDAFPERLGDFRLLRRLGGGGMGVVYLATQESLGREVALKLVRPETLYFPGARERFRREAEAVARLQHQNIVPVFTVGEEKGIPFFAMERVHGCSISQVIARLAGKAPGSLTGKNFAAAVDACLRENGALSPSDPPVAENAFGRSWVEACFRVALEAAEALVHAHARGVLHRDMKPSNLMVTADGRVRLVDFGLAVLVGSDRITRTGTQLGSVAYMAPEQVRGQADQVGVRSDVYSLGATLYEMLALVAPFEDSHAEALQLRIIAEAPRPLQQVNSTVPWDAETVCLTMLEKDPARRYATATDLATDLRNVLELRPIAAKRPGPLLRARRFAQRHPAWTVAAVLGTILVLGGPIGFAIQQRHANVEIGKQKDRAEASLARTFEAIDRMLVRLSDERLVRVPRMAAVRHEVLQDALAIYRSVLADQDDNPQAQLGAGDVHRHVADLHALLGEPDAAIAEYTAAEDLLTRAVDRGANGPAARINIALARWRHARTLHEVGRDAESFPLWRRAIEDLERSVAELADDPFAAISWAQCLNELATAQLDIGQRAESLASRRASLDRIDAVLKKWPDLADARARRASYLANLGGVLQAWGRPDEAEPYLRQAIDALEPLLALDPTDTTIRSLTCETHNGLGQIAMAHDRTDEALREFSLATNGARDTLADDPDVVQNREQLLHMLILHGDAAMQCGRLDEAETMLSEGVSHARRLIEMVPSNATYRTLLADVVGETADLRRRQGRIDDAVTLYHEAIDVLTLLAREQPESEAHRVNSAFDREELAAIADSRGDLEKAFALRVTALADLREARRLFPELQNVHDLEYTTSIHHANVLFARRDHRAMRALVDEMAALRYDEADKTLRRGHILLNLAALLRDDAALDAAERNARIDAALGEAAAQLARAKELGQPDVAGLLKSDIVTEWRADARIAKLIGE